MPEKRITVTVPPEIHKQAKIIAAKEGRPLSDVVRELLEKWMKEQEEKEAKDEKTGA